MTSTVVVAKCVSKKETNSYNKENPIKTVIELEVPYDQSSIYHKMSGGSNFELNTVNQAAADMFTLNGEFEITIKPHKVVEG